MKKTKILIGIFIFGMIFGYLAGLVHQAAQKAHKINCETCQYKAGH